MVKFMKYYVTDGEHKIRVSYSYGALVSGVKCVTLYSKDYSHDLAKVFPGQYQNGTDIMTDYFEHGRVRIMPDSPLFSEALSRCPSYQMEVR